MYPITFFKGCTDPTMILDREQYFDLKQILHSDPIMICLVNYCFLNSLILIGYSLFVALYPGH